MVSDESSLLLSPRRQSSANDQCHPVVRQLHEVGVEPDASPEAIRERLERMRSSYEPYIAALAEHRDVLLPAPTSAESP